MQILLWNIHRGRELEGSAERLCRAVGEVGIPDILVLVEADTDFPLLQRVFDETVIAARLGLHNILPDQARSTPCSSGFFGLSIFARATDQLRKVSVHDLPCAGEPRGFVLAQMSCREHDVWLGVTHLSLGRSVRSRQVRRIASLTVEADPIILAGDFNEWKKVGSLSDLTRQGFVQLSPVAGFPAGLPFLALDRFLLRGIAGGRVELPPVSERWGDLSDHRPVMSWFDIDRIETAP